MTVLSSFLTRLRIDKSASPHRIWCLVRKIWCFASPEEIVRQSAILHLIDLGYPPTRISVEKQLAYNKLTRRYDIVVHDSHGAPYILVECKASSVTLNQAAMDQAMAYNRALSSTYIWITNGYEHQIIEASTSQMGLKYQTELPPYNKQHYIEEE